MMIQEKKKIEDYLHLYLGCQIQWDEYPDQIEKMTIVLLDAIYFEDLFEEYKPILRPLSSMTKEENLKELDSIKIMEDKTSAEIQAEIVRQRLLKGIDLFGLIEAGLAIDANSFKTNHTSK